MNGIPTELAEEEYFGELFEQSAKANLNAHQQEEYQKAMTTERDIQNQIKYAYKEGREQGIEKGREEGILLGEQRGKEAGKAEGKAEGETSAKLSVAKSMKADGLPVEMIVKYSGLTAEQVAAL